MTLPAEIAAMRRESQMTQAQCGAACDPPMSQSQWADHERGRFANPGWKTLRRLALATGNAPDYLLRKLCEPGVG